MDEKTKNSLLLAYGIIREQEGMIYSLTALVTPLIKCLGQYDQRLADLYAKTAKDVEEAIFQDRNDGFDVIDKEVLRLKRY